MPPFASQSKISSNRRSDRSGFSLVEVILAVGIIATIMVPIVALVGLGLDTIRESHRDVIDSQIVNLVENELSLTDWKSTDNLATIDGQVKKFSRDGISVDREEDAVYAAKILVDAVRIESSGPSADYARRVEVRLTSVPATITSRFDNRQFYRRYSILVARLGQ